MRRKVPGKALAFVGTWLLAGCLAVDPPPEGAIDGTPAAGGIALEGVTGAPIGGVTKAPIGPATVEERTLPTASEWPELTRLFERYRLREGDALEIHERDPVAAVIPEGGLAPGGVVSVKFLDQPELNMTRRIQDDGTLPLPFIGPVMVVGKEFSTLATELEGLYAPVLPAPRIVVDAPRQAFRVGVDSAPAGLPVATRPESTGWLVVVDREGTLTLPLLGRIPVRGKSVPEVEAELDAAVMRLVEGRRFDLELRRYHGPLLFVTGRVRAPGVVPLEEPLAPVDALALAGGAVEGALLREALILGHREGEITIRRVDLVGDDPLAGGSGPMQPGEMLLLPGERIDSWEALQEAMAGTGLHRLWSQGEREGMAARSRTARLRKIPEPGRAGE
ncbi:MAG: polysaccharide biosynthesis/export family protein [Magnetococcales bacterium]|nr:polysaccharide biosynthesis/export family protein [Magnetococcales bacterium]MBF0156600.1 polysaccharide biosynthesis/export family protein [Magnetococcales bacterium]